MATVGLIGGLGPESTVDYYKRIIEVWKRDTPDSAPSMLIDSLDVLRGLQLVTTSHEALAEYLLESVLRLTRAGVDFIAITANTPHIVFDALSDRSTVPLLSIVEVCAQAARDRNHRRLLLLGTRFTMEATFFPDTFRRYGLDIVVPEEPDRLWLHERYVGELLPGDFRAETRAGVTGLIERCVRDCRVDGVVLAGTELPLLLRTQEVVGVPLLDTTALHVAAIVQQLRAGGKLTA